MCAEEVSLHGLLQPPAGKCKKIPTFCCEERWPRLQTDLRSTLDMTETQHIVNYWMHFSLSLLIADLELCCPGPKWRFYLSKYKAETSKIPLNQKRHQYSAQMMMQEPLTSGKMWEDHCFSDPVVPVKHFYNPMLEMFQILITRICLFQQSTFYSNPPFSTLI